MFVRGTIRIDVIILFASLLYSMDFRCGRREALVCMEGMVQMVGWIIVGIAMSVLVAGIIYGIYMAVWGVYDEFY